MSKWVATGKYGIRYREHEKKTTGIGRNKRPLRYYTAVYKWQGKVVTDAFGWEGEDFRNEDEITAVTLELRQNRRNRVPPFTLKDLRSRREAELADLKKCKEEELSEQKRQTRLIFDTVFSQYCETHYQKVSLRDEISYHKNWIFPYIGRKRLDEITLFDLERIRKKMADAGKAPRSILYVKNIVRQVYHFAIEINLYTGTIPTTHFLKKLKIDNRRLRYLSPAEADDLLQELRRHSETSYRIALLSLNSGMRFGEIASLRWQHVREINRELLVIDPKSGDSRGVHMTDTVFQMFTVMSRGKPEDLVFPSTNGKKMTAISKVFGRAVKTLGLNEGITDNRMRVVFHTLRHSCASWLVNSGVEIPVIAKILGHKTLSMTMRYAHVNDSSVKNAMQHLDRQQYRKKPNISNK